MAECDTFRCFHWEYCLYPRADADPDSNLDKLFDVGLIRLFADSPYSRICGVLDAKCWGFGACALLDIIKDRLVITLSDDEKLS